MSNTDMTMREALWWRHCMPYGVWWCRDGRVVMFNRVYQPIVEWIPKQGPRVPASCREYALPYERWEPQHADADVCNFVHQRWLYSDGNSPWHASARGGDTRIRVMLVLTDFLDGKMPMRVQ